MLDPARLPDDASPERAAFVRYLRTGRRAAPLELKFNPYHDPETGQFRTAEGASGASQAGLEPASLNFFDKATARAAYATNFQHLAKNIKKQFKRVGGRSFTAAQLKSILSDVLDGPSTSMDGLRLFADPSISRFNMTRIRVINTYVGELPSTPLNNSVKSGWKSYLARMGVSR